MQVVPAIDLRGGRCVRLQQGDFGRELIFGEDPAAMAAYWQSQGATRLHLVDLDGAKTGQPANVECVRAILAKVSIPCQLGGGIRSDESAEAWLSAGVDRVIIGTQVLKDPAWFRRLAARFPDRVALGLDAREGNVATEGWLEVSQVNAADLAERFDNLPLAAVIYTDIARDGMMAGPNVEAVDALAARLSSPVMASGGVGSLDDVRRLSALPIAGCIVGRALYEGRLQLRDALAIACTGGRDAGRANHCVPDIKG